MSATSDEGAETLRFACDGVNYTIDLTKASREDFEQKLAPFIAAARVLPGSGTRRPRAAPQRAT